MIIRLAEDIESTLDEIAIRTGPFLEKARTRVPSLGTRQLKNPWSTARAITLKRSEKTPQTLYAK